MDWQCGENLRKISELYVEERIHQVSEEGWAFLAEEAACPKA